MGDSTNGSKIVVTAHNGCIASSLAENQPLKLAPLSYADRQSAAHEGYQAEWQGEAEEAGWTHLEREMVLQRRVEKTARK